MGDGKLLGVPAAGQIATHHNVNRDSRWELEEALGGVYNRLTQGYCELRRVSPITFVAAEIIVFNDFANMNILYLYENDLVRSVHAGCPPSNGCMNELSRLARSNGNKIHDAQRLCTRFVEDWEFAHNKHAYFHFPLDARRGRQDAIDARWANGDDVSVEHHEGETPVSFCPQDVRRSPPRHHT